MNTSISRISKGLTQLAAMIVLLIFMQGEAKATHIVGAELSYRVVNVERVEFTFILRTDCEFGIVDAIDEDFTNMTVFDLNNEFLNGLITDGIRNGRFSLARVSRDTVDEMLNSDCQLFADPVCVLEAVYRMEVELKANQPSGGYQIVHQRCCRNASLSNVVDPLGTGMTQVLTITNEELSRRNRAPDLPDFPPIYACSGQPFVVDQGGTDPDGDQLSYRLYTPLTYDPTATGDTLNHPNTTLSPPYSPITWEAGYSLGNMMLTTPGLTIDANTGVISVTPAAIGQYQVGFCVDELASDGRVVNSTCREFEVNVRACGAPPTVDIDDIPAILCDANMITVSGTTDADAAYWIFDGDTFMVDPNNPEVNLVIGDEGTYTIYFVGDNAGCTAIDSTTFDALFSGIGGPDGFEVNVLDCTNELTIEVADTIIGDTSNPITLIEYTIMQGGVTIFDTTGVDGFVYTFDGDVNVAICQTITTTNGCDENSCMNFTFELFDIVISPDTLDLCIGDVGTVSVTHVLDSPITVVWTMDPIIDSIMNDGQNITVLVTDTTSRHLVFTATDMNGCSLTDSVFVTAQSARPDLDFSVEKACDSLGVIITNTSIDSVAVIWAFGDGQTSTEWEPGYTYASNGTYTITLTGGDAECETTVTRTLVLEDLELNVDVTNLSTGGDIFCEPADGILVVTVNNAEGPLTYQWEPPYNVTGGTNGDTLRIFVDSSLTYCVTVVDQETGCEATECVDIELGKDVSANLVSPEGTICAGDTVKVAAVVSGDDADCNYAWTYSGSAVGEDDTDTLCFIASASQTVTVTVGCSGGCMDNASISIDVRDLNSIIRAIIDPDTMTEDNQVFQLDVENGEDDWSYVWSGEGDFNPNNMIKDPLVTAGPIGDYTWTVDVIDEFGCEATSSVSVSPPMNLPCEFPYVFVPNAFSPNGSDAGANETVRVYGREVDEIISFIIYNRWGQEVYRVDNVPPSSVSWDGTYEGELGHNAVFGYYLHARCITGDETQQQGNISLLR